MAATSISRLRCIIGNYGAINRINDLNPLSSPRFESGISWRIVRLRPSRRFSGVDVGLHPLRPPAMRRRRRALAAARGFGVQTRIQRRAANAAKRSLFSWRGFNSRISAAPSVTTKAEARPGATATAYPWAFRHWAQWQTVRHSARRPLRVRHRRTAPRRRRTRRPVWS